MGKTVVVALGGNAILQPKQRGTAGEQFANVRLTCEHVAAMIAEGHRVVITHGNGPQVGNILIQNEEGSGLVPAMPLDVCGAESQGFIGYMVQQSLRNELRRLGSDKAVATVITQVLVDPSDPAFGNPTKPIGPFFTPDKARELMTHKGYQMKEDAGRGWRRVVPSPDPKAIVERDAIRTLVEAGTVVIACGGGGVPVLSGQDGTLLGAEAVIDKDLAANRLALDIDADILLVLTDVECACLDFRGPSEVRLGMLTVERARQYLAEGHFREGSMGPKVEAILRFVEAGGELGVITSLTRAKEALDGNAGTRICRNQVSDGIRLVG